MSVAPSFRWDRIINEEKKGRELSLSLSLSLSHSLSLSLLFIVWLAVSGN